MAIGARRASVLAAWAAGAALLLSSASAQPARTAAAVTRDREAAVSEAQKLRQDAAVARNEINGLNQRLAATRARGSEALAAEARAMERLSLLNEEAAHQADEHRAYRRAYEDAVIAAAFAERGIGQDPERFGVFAAAAAGEFALRLTQSQIALREIDQKVAAIDAEQSLLADARTAIAGERAAITNLIGEARLTEVRLARGAADAERRAQRLAREARSLQELARRTEQASRRRSGGAQTARAGASGAALLPASWIAPVSGQIVHRFGQREGSGPASAGVTLRTAPGARVVAPAAGEIVYARLFRSYGQVLILNVNGGYALVLTGLETVHAREGEAVQAGQTLGIMSASAAPAPDLYVEVRRDGRSLDPARWLAGRGLVAQANGRAG